MKALVYESKAAASLTLVQAGLTREQYIAQDKIEPDAKLIHIIDGEEWDDCKAKYDQWLIPYLEQKLK